ncbi:MAG: PHP domain-containing protein [Actinomycetales bacterium]
MRADLHTHSTESDGTEPPAIVIAQAAAAGLDVVALTDHDTTGGWDEAGIAADRLGIDLIRGIEISTRRQGASIHLLGYGVSTEDGPLADELAQTRISRETRARHMVDLIAQDYPLSWEQVLAQVPTPETTIGRPHIADAMVAAGLMADRDEAFASVLHNRSPYHVTHYAPDVAHAVRVVKAAGGRSVLAHSLARKMRRPLDEELLDELVDAGLDGLEVAHRDHDAHAQEQLRRWAVQRDLIMTGGSDYHGDGKKNRIAENLTSPEMVARLR